MMLAAGVIIGSHMGSHTTAPPAAVPRPGTILAPPPAAALATDFAELETKLHAVAGIAVSAVGNGQTPMRLGDLESGPAWSTIKVPLIIAALREENPPKVTSM